VDDAQTTFQIHGFSRFTKGLKPYCSVIPAFAHAIYGVATVLKYPFY
jgi:hypothetical protein